MYDFKFEFLNYICIYGLIFLGLFVFLFLINMIWSWMYGLKVGDNFWGGLFLEWIISLFFIIENWEVLLVVIEGFYDFGFKKIFVIREWFKLIFILSLKVKEIGVFVFEVDFLFLYSGFGFINDF